MQDPHVCLKTLFSPLRSHHSISPRCIPPPVVTTRFLRPRPSTPQDLRARQRVQRPTQPFLYLQALRRTLLPDTELSFSHVPAYFPSSRASLSMAHRPPLQPLTASFLHTRSTMIRRRRSTLIVTRSPCQQHRRGPMRASSNSPFMPWTNTERVMERVTRARESPFLRETAAFPQEQGSRRFRPILPRTDHRFRPYPPPQEMGAATTGPASTITSGQRA